MLLNITTEIPFKIPLLMTYITIFLPQKSIKGILR